MIEFVQKHPDYLFLLFLVFFLIYKVIISILLDNPPERDSDEDGGITVNDPELDLPPGVSLPEKEKGILI